MKNLSVFIIALLSGVANAQVVDTCEVWFNDTIRYIDAKTSAYSGISINQINDGGSYGYAGYAQKFEAPDTVTIEGVCFYGVMDSGGSFSAAVKMYDGSGGTPGTLVTGTTHVVPYLGSGYTGPMNDQSILQCAIFPAPIEWEGDYFVGVENFSSSDMYIARNATGNGATEDLMFFYYKGVSDATYDGWYQAYANYGNPWDFDVIMRPIVSYKGQSIISYDTTVCLGDTLSLEYEFMLDDSVLYNKFYNPGFATYDGSYDSIGLDYGDMTSPTLDTFHLYGSDGNYNVTLTAMASTSGWGTDNFMSQCVVTTEVVDAYYDIVDQSACNGDTVYFVAPAGYDNYLWSDMFNTDDSTIVETFFLSNGDYDYFVDMTLKGCSARDSMVLSIGELTIDLGGDTTVCLNQNVMLTAGTYDSYDWNTGQTTESIQVGPFVNPGSEEVVLTVAQGNCSGTDTVLITIDNCLGVEDVQSFDLEVYPNPTTGQVYLNSSENIQEIWLFNISGQMVHNIAVNNQQMFDFGNLPEGVYLLEVGTEKGSLRKKIQIIH